MIFDIDDFFEMLAVEAMVKTHTFKKKKCARLEDALGFSGMCMKSTANGLRLLKRG